jgi:TonB-linked SusC/RagA family outer membrane protein
MNPVQSVYEEKGSSPPSYVLQNAPGTKIPNPVASANGLNNKVKANRIQGNAYSKYNIIPNLTLKSEIGIDLLSRKSGSFTPSYIQQGQSGTSASVHNERKNMFISENTIRYDKDIGQDHLLDILGGFSYQKNIREGSTAGSQQFVTNSLGYYSLDGGTVFNRPYSRHTKWNLISYFGRIRYNFDEKYLITVSNRLDGSSRFGENNKYGYFPSGAIAWRLNNEEFINDLGIFSQLKLRTSYGIVGNQEIGSYQSLSTLGSASYTIGGTQNTGFYPNKIANKNLKWERTRELDIGLDVGLFNGRLSATSDYYRKTTTDLLYNSAIPWSSGFSTSLQNVGSIRSQGLELAIESSNIVGNEFNWSTSFNISFVSTEVLSLGGERLKNVGPGSGHLKVYNPHRLQVGKPISVFYGYVFDGLFQSQQELEEGPDGPTNWLGGRRYKDISGPNGEPDGRITANYDKTIIGNPHPDFYGGLSNSFTYSGFKLGISLKFAYGNDIMNYNNFDLELPSGGQNVYEEMKDHWSQDNSDENVYPKPTTNRSQVFSSRQIEDGSYLKLQNVTLSYRFPNVVGNLNSVSSLRFHISMRNYYTLTRYNGYDPDVSFRGITNLSLGEDYNQYPKTKSINVGINIGF